MGLSGVIEVRVNCPTAEDAARIARAAVEARLAASANLLAPMRSWYRWEGELVEREEVPLLLKTRPDLFDPLAALVAGLHPWEVPAITAVRLDHVSESYAEWVRAETLTAPAAG